MVIIFIFYLLYFKSIFTIFNMELSLQFYIIYIYFINLLLLYMDADCKFISYNIWSVWYINLYHSNFYIKSIENTNIFFLISHLNPSIFHDSRAFCAFFAKRILKSMPISIYLCKTSFINTMTRLTISSFI